MSTTIRIDVRDKQRLRRLQEKWRRVHGRELPQKELLERALAYVERHQAEFVVEEGWKPLSDEQIAAMRVGQGNYGRWSSDDIDDIVYGEDP